MNNNNNNNNFRREKLFYVVMIIFYLAFPFTFFFNVFEYRSKRNTIDGNITTVVEKYNLINLNDLSTFLLVVSILYMIISLTLAIFLIIDLYKGKYYRVHIKILSGLSVVMFGGLFLVLSLYLGILFFMTVCCNLFILSFDYKLTKKRKTDILIYVPIYILFLLMLVLALGFHPMS